MTINIPNIQTIKEMNEQEFNTEISKIKEKLFELRLKKATKQTIKPHLFKQTKNRLAQLLTIRSQIQKK